VTNQRVLSALRQRLEHQYRVRTPRSRALHQQAESYLPELLSSEAYERLDALGQHLGAALQEVVDRRGVALDVTTAASLVSLDVLPAARSAASVELMRLLQLALLTRGIKTSSLLAVSTVTTEAEIDRLAAAVDDVLGNFASAIEAEAPSLLRVAPQPV
jgi:glutamate-1-semialdehyde aminotransferase